VMPARFEKWDTSFGEVGVSIFSGFSPSELGDTSMVMCTGEVPPFVRRFRGVEAATSSAVLDVEQLPWNSASASEKPAEFTL